MSARVLVVGVDAMEVDVVDRLIGEGRLPTFARLADSAATVRPEVPLDTLPGAIWPELSTGVAGWRSGLFFHPRQLHSGESQLRPLSHDAVSGEDQYWIRAARQGCRVLSVDMPQAVSVPDLPTAVQVCEWGVHDRLWGCRSEPPDEIDAIEATWGPPLVDLCDVGYAETDAGYRALRDDLLAQVDRKRGWLSEMIERERWDLVTCTFGELHCAGHQLLHLFEPTNRWHDPAAPADLRHALGDAYAAVDDAIGCAIAAAGPEATVIVVASHGMDMYIGGYQLLGDVLDRLLHPHPPIGGLASSSWMPERLKALARVVVPAALRRRRRQLAGEIEWPLDATRTRAVAVPNNRVGGIRINLQGREPHGSVAPGAEADALMAEIVEALLELRHPESGQPLVTNVDRTDERFGPDRHPDLPDLIVGFRRDLGPLEACESPRLGRVDSRLRHPDFHRSGDHTDHARWWLRAPGLAPAARGVEVAAVDLAPTVLRALDVPLPSHLDGRPLDLTRL